MPIYFKLTDTDTLAMQNNDSIYIYDKETQQWQADKEGRLAGRLTSIGHLEEITEEDAMTFIDTQVCGYGNR